MQRLFASLIVFVLALALFFSVFPVPYEFGPLIKVKMEERINGTVELDGVSVIALPYPRVTIKSFTLKDDKETIVRSGKLKMSLALVPFIMSKFKLVEISKVTMEGGEILIKRSPDGEINILRVRKEKERAVTLKLLKLKGGNVTVIDEVPDVPVTLEMAGISSLIYPTRTGLTYSAEGLIKSGGRIECSGAISISESVRDKWQLTGTLTLDEVRLDPIEPYILELIPGDYKGGAEFMGVLSLDTTYSFKGPDIGRPFDGEGLVKGKLVTTGNTLKLPKIFTTGLRSESTSATVEVSWTPDKFFAAVLDARIKLSTVESKPGEPGARGGLNLAGHLTLKGANPPGPGSTLETSATIDPVGAETLLELLPWTALPEGLTEVLRKIESPAGKLAIENISYSGPVGGATGTEYLKRLSIALNLNGLAFKHPAFKKALSGLTGKVKLYDGSLFVKGLRGKYGSTLMGDLRLDVKDLAGSVLPYALSVEVSVNTEEVLEELTRSGFIDPPETFAVKGKARSRLNLEGTLKTESSLKYWGTVNLDGVDITYEMLPFALEGLKGEAAFDSDKVTVNWFKGSAGGSDFSVKGEILQYQSSKPLFQMETELTLQPGTSARLMKDYNIDGPEVTGPIYMKGDVKGNPREVTVATSFDLTQTGLSYGRMINKPHGFPILLDTSLNITNEGIVIERGSASFGESTVAFNGALSKKGFAFKYVSDKVLLSDLTSLNPYIAASDETKGFMAFDVTVKKGTERPVFGGKITVKDLSVATPYLKNPVTGTEATARLSGKTVSVVIDEIKTGRSSFSGKVDFTDIYEGTVSFDLLSKYLDPADLLPASGTGTRKPDLEPFITGSGKVTVAAGNVWRFNFKNPSTDVTITKEEILFPVSFTSHQGHASGEAVYFRGGAGEDLFTAKLDLSKLSLDEIISEIGAKTRILTGRADARVDFVVKRHPYGIVPGLGGTFQLLAEDGKLWKLVVFSKIFSIVNIFSISELFEEGLPYRTLDGTFPMDGGVIKTENLSLESPSMRMSAVGEINWNDLTMDTMLALHPFVTLDKIISTIPLAGWIIAGEDASTLTMYYNVDGPLKDPSVEPRTIKSMGKGVLGILRRTLESPAKAIEPFVPPKKGDEKDKGAEVPVAPSPSPHSVGAPPDED